MLDKICIVIHARAYQYMRITYIIYTTFNVLDYIKLTCSCVHFQGSLPTVTVQYCHEAKRIFNVLLQIMRNGFFYENWLFFLYILSHGCLWSLHVHVCTCVHFKRLSQQLPYNLPWSEANFLMVQFTRAAVQFKPIDSLQRRVAFSLPNHRKHSPKCGLFFMARLYGLASSFNRALYHWL